MTDYSATYIAFHIWLRKNRRAIAARSNRTVIYSGMTKGGVPQWKQLPAFEKQTRLLFGVRPGWMPIETVLRSRKLRMDLGAVARGDPRIEQALPVALTQPISVWLFACSAAKEGWVTPEENKQIWKNLSACYVRNAKGKVWMFVGQVLKEFPDLLLAEIPTLLKNKQLDRDTIERAQRLAPKSAMAWKKYRDTADGAARLAGR